MEQSPIESSLLQGLCVNCVPSHQIFLDFAISCYQARERGWVLLVSSGCSVDGVSDGECGEGSQEFGLFR